MNSPRMGLAALICAVGCAVGLSQAHATTVIVNYTMVAESGDTKTGAGGWAGAINQLDPPTINASGDLAFRGKTNATGQNAALWYAGLVGSVYAVEKVLQQGDAAPDYAQVVIAGDGVNLSGFSSGLSQPLLRDDGELAFGAGIQAVDSYPAGLTANYGEQAIYKGTPSGVQLMCAAPDFFLNDTSRQTYYLSVAAAAPMRAYSHLSIPKTGHNAVSWYVKAIFPHVQPPMHKGGVYWGATPRDPIGTSTPPAPDNYDPIAEEAEQIDGVKIFGVPDVENYFTAVSSSSPAPNHIYGTFSARDENWTGGNPPNHSHMIVVVEDHPTNGEDKDLVAQSNVTTAPGAPNSPKFDNLQFAPAINNDGDIAFRAQTEDADKWGVWKAIESGGSYTISKVAYDGDAVPGLTGVDFHRFGDPVINGSGIVAFAARYTQSSVEKTGIFRKSGASAVATVARESTPTPLVPNEPTRALGTYDSTWGDPSVNDTGNVVYLADVNITDSTLAANLSSVNRPANGPAIFVTDYLNTPRTVVSVGMKVEDLIGGNDDRVITNLQFLSEDTSTIGADTTLEANGSGHEDGRRVGVTNQYIDSGNSDCRNVKVAFWAELKEGAVTTEANFVAELKSCADACTSCLCSTDPDCLMMGMTLNDGPDFNGNGFVDDDDLTLTLMAVGYTHSRFDLNRDGIVDSVDVAIVADQYKIDSEQQKESK